ncbi:MAG: ribonuclease HIII [Negativicutes bacterium]|nr:ribonuclease HIII [Negativicutes bacterium]
MSDIEDYITDIKDKLGGAGFVVNAEKKLEYGFQLTVTDGIDRVYVNVYSGQKGVSLVVAGSAKLPLKQAVQELVGERSAAASPNVADMTGVPGFEGVAGFDNCWIGTDESGKGDFFGPLVVAAVRVDATTAAALEAAGVKDSKALADSKAKRLAARIREICAGHFVELEMLPARYNALYCQLRGEGKNLNHLLAWGHARVLEDLLQKAPCRFALADKFANEKFIQSRLMEKGRQILLVQTPKAERNIAVAAASVLARERFLNRMEEMAVRFGIVFPKGASLQVVEAAKIFAEKRGKPALVEVAKTHFRTMDEI